MLITMAADSGGWERLVREHTFTVNTDTQRDYPLPDDFAYMIDQTGWMRDQNVPVAGPLSSQDWQYLLGRNLVSSTIYASFRINLGLFRVFAQGIVSDEELAYEYMSENWVQPAGETNQDNFTSKVASGSDVILFPDMVITLFLKGRFLGAKGMDTTKADAEFSSVYLSVMGLNKSAAKLNAARNYLGYPYLDAWRNLPDTGYGNKPIMG